MPISFSWPELCEVTLQINQVTRQHCQLIITKKQTDYICAVSGDYKTPTNYVHFLNETRQICIYLHQSGRK